MPSPFPGMNSYLEQDDVWHDFHERFIPLVATLLGGQLRPRYIIKIDEHIYVHELAAESLRLVGRANVSLGRISSATVNDPASGPATGLLEAPPIRSWSVRPRDAQTRRSGRSRFAINCRQSLPVLAPDSDARLDLQNKSGSNLRRCGLCRLHL